MRTMLAREGLTISTAARRLGVARPNLHGVLAGRTALSPLMAMKFPRLTGVDAALLLDMQAHLQLSRVEQGYPRRKDDFLAWGSAPIAADGRRSDGVGKT